MCLAVTCHLQFWQKDQEILRATAVTRGWNGYRNKSQHRKLTLEKKILPSESRRDQQEGGELDSHEEASPEEMKSREVVLG